MRQHCFETKNLLNRLGAFLDEELGPRHVYHITGKSLSEGDQWAWTLPMLSSSQGQ